MLLLGCLGLELGHSLPEVGRIICRSIFLELWVDSEDVR